MGIGRTRKGAYVTCNSVKKMAAFFLVLCVLGVLSPLSILAAVDSEGRQIEPLDIQKALKEAGYYQGTVDGVVGPKTRAAIRSFQEAKGLKVDGVCGPHTWDVLKVYLNPPPAPEPSQAASQPVLNEAPAPYEEDTNASLYEPEPLPAEGTGDDLKQKLIS